MYLSLNSPESDAMLQSFQEHVNAEDEEQSNLRLYLNGSIAYVKHLINRDFNELDENELKIFNMCVLQIATSWYLNRDGSAKGTSNTYSAINPMIETLRVPAIGGD